MRSRNFGGRIGGNTGRQARPPQPAGMPVQGGPGPHPGDRTDPPARSWLTMARMPSVKAWPGDEKSRSGAPRGVAPSRRQPRKGRT